MAKNRLSMVLLQCSFYFFSKLITFAHQKIVKAMLAVLGADVKIVDNP
ncbi:MAG TPA: hypothetical protein VN379_07120 [Sporomusa sp.]|nr:hypothetical protein [Sporomusa sp.]